MKAEAAAFWAKIIAGVALLYALMAGVAGALESTRGEAGLLIAALILAAALAYDRLAFTRAYAESWRALGLGVPHWRGLGAAVLVSAALAASLPLIAPNVGAALTLRDDWLILIPGLLAQAGFAEELVFRGFLFGRIRHGRSFWRSVALSIPPFALVHLVMFATMPWPVAAASVALAIIISAPLAHAYELAGGTIWAPALLHATVQGAIKLVDIEGDATGLAIAWIAACATLPFLVFLWRRPSP
ncbi:MAG: lysostaphin resistance A-like protein [Hyphomonadaceae bacterium]